MRGMLVDVSVQGHLPYVVSLLQALRLRAVMEELELRFATFPDLGPDRRPGGRPLWEFCQRDDWVLLTDSRDYESEDSLQATLDDSWQEGHLPILTLSNKGRFENQGDYAVKVAEDTATVLFGIISDGEYRDRPRIDLPFQWT